MSWAVSIRKGQKRLLKLFPCSPGKTTTDLYKEAKEFRLKVIKRDPTIVCEIISRKIAFPPKGEIPKGYWWCPYCAKPRKFMPDEVHNTRNCIICGISDSDWHVRKHNIKHYPIEDRYSYCAVHLLKGAK